MDSQTLAHATCNSIQYNILICNMYIARTRVKSVRIKKYLKIELDYSYAPS